jgi:tetratricopeptide (TPR) repeat protein
VKKAKPSQKSWFKKNELLWPLFIFLLAFLVRFIYLTQIKASLPSFYAPNMDESFHDIWAQRIAFGEGMGGEPFFKGPLYVYLLAFLYKVFGHNYYLPRFLQIISGSASCVFVFLIAKKLFNRTVGIISGLIAAFYATLIFYDGELMIESLIIFMDLVLIYLLINCKAKSSLKRWVGCGAVLGLSAIARPNILIFVPFVLVWMFYAFGGKLASKEILIRWLIFSLGVLLLVFPITLRNLVVGKDLVLIGWQGGHNFYLGNNPQATGWSVTAAQIDASWWGGYHDAKRVAQQETGKQLKPSEISRFWYNKGMDFMLSSPFLWIKLMINKAIYFWKGFEIPNDKDFYLNKNFSSLFNLLLRKAPLYLPFGLIGPLSILGMAIGLRRWRRNLLLYLFILSYSLSVVIFFVCSRFRMPVVPFLIIFTSFFIWWTIDMVKRKEFSKLLIPLPALLILLVFLNTGRGKVVSESEQQAQNHFILGTTYEHLGQLQKAGREYQAALRYNPEFASAYNNLGIIHGRMGNPGMAIQQLKKAIQLDPDYARAYFNLGVIYQNTDSLNLAEEAYSKAVGISPDYEAAHLNLGKVYFRKGMKENAKEEWQKVLQLNPDNQEARMCLQLK